MIAVTAGVAAPLTILAAGVAVVLLAFTVAELTKAELSARLDDLHLPGGTPVNALLVMAGGGLGIIAVWWVAHLVGLDTGYTNPVGLYAECSTMGTTVILFVYFLTTLSLPVFMWRRHPSTGSGERTTLADA